MSAILVAGCGEEPTKVDLTKKTDTDQFKGMIQDQMKDHVKADKTGGNR